MPGHIEVGDTFEHDTAPKRQVTAVSINDAGWIHDDAGFTNHPARCRLIRKAAKDPYAGLTLPTPPAGYRLAKWGEEAGMAVCYKQHLSDWVAWGGRLVNSHAIYDATDPHNCIYAIPLDQPASAGPQSWQFRHAPWVPPQPKTLADCPQSTPVISPDNAGQWHVVYRIGTQVFCQGAGTYFSSASEAKFIRYLDPPHPAPLKIEDVPDGRMIKQANAYHWCSNRQWYVSLGDGTIDRGSPSGLIGFTVTDYTAEFK